MVFLFKLPRMLPVAVFLLLGLTSVSASAAEPTPEQQEIIDAIKNYAERHVDRNEPSNPERVFDLYENNEVGLSLPEIAKIYEDEFDRLKAEVKPSFWEQIQPNLGWAAAVFFAVLAIFGNALKGILKDAVNKLKEKLYIKFAGSRLMRRKALRRYREALIERYGEVDIAFRPNKPLAMADLFVPLKVSDRPDSEQIDADEALHQHRRLMIKGDPGSGKSMLLRHLAFAFANDDLFLEDDPIPVLLELHRLSESDKSIADHLVDVFKRNDFPNAGTFVRQALSRGGLLLLFDGLDEVASARRNAVVKQLRDFLDTNKCRALITCRTAVYRGDFDADVDASLQMVEFSDQQITRFLGAWAPQMPAHKSIDQLMGTLRDRPRIMGLARNPLLLTIVAYLYTDTPEELPRSRAGFYELATNILIGQWHKDHNRYEARDKLAVLRKLARFNQETETIQDHDRRSIAFQDVLKEVKDVLPDLNLNPEIDTTKIVDEIVERSGLLLAIDAGERYQFAHLTLQEFFVASALRDAPENLLQFYQMDPDGWREPVKLWCGLANDSTHIIKTVYGIDPLTSLECLVETKSVDGDLAEEIIETFKEQLNKPKPQSGVLRALGGISADRRPRGKEVFAFLTNCLKECQPDSSRFKNAARALSFSNLPKAALHLGERYIEETREHLIRMGDLAVPCLESLATKGNPNAIEDLGTIGTPRAAKALVPLLWHDADTVSLPAAWPLDQMFAMGR